jgi:hypothetical protein
MWYLMKAWHTLSRACSVGVIVLLLISGVLPAMAAETERALPLAAGPDAMTILSVLQGVDVSPDIQHIFSLVDNGRTIEVNVKDRSVVALYSMNKADGEFKPWRLVSSGGLELKELPSQTASGFSGDISLWSFEIDTPGTYTLAFDRYDPDIPSTPAFHYAITLVVKNHWKTSFVDNTTGRVTGNGQYTSLTFGDDTPHISYFAPSNGGVKYATRNNGKWEIPDAIGSRGTWATSIDLDKSTGYPSFTFSDSDANIGDLKYAYYNGEKWNWEYIERPVSGADCRRIGYWSSFRFAPNGTAHVAYGNAHKNVWLVYATRENGDWKKEVIDTYDAGYEPSLAFNATGYPFIAYRSMAYAPSLAYWVGSLKFAERGPDGQWKITTVDDAQNWGDTGRDLSLALDSRGNPHISYVNRNPHDGTNNGLRYTSRDSSGKWTGESVDKSAGTDDNDRTSLVLDASDKAYIAYASKGELRIAMRNEDSARWNLEVIDRGNVGKYASLALDRSGYPAVSYGDYDHQALKYAEWVTE